MPPRPPLWPWLLLGCGGALAAVVAFVVFIVSVAFGALRASEPYTTSLERARHDPRVVAALGSPIEAGWMVSGKINIEGGEGFADLDIRIAGAKQKGTIYVVGTKKRGRWSYDEMTVTPENGPGIDLRTWSERSPSTDPPAE
ncbi:MAG TPA: cytochrome c oxidase assembly factor Coa1 family protein [Thermoanaerobaculia bacterium]|nr:cytochrome c oxidase assembly factor Coa1 family protein [Thermoanaerobaculia bacterium]